MFYHAPITCFEHSPWRFYRWNGCSTETERLYHTTEGAGSRQGSSDTGSGFVIILGTWKRRGQTYRLRLREAIRLESTGTSATTRRRLPVQSPRINCVSDKLLISRYSAGH